MATDYVYLSRPAAQRQRVRARRVRALRRWLEWGAFLSASLSYVWALSLVAA